MKVLEAREEDVKDLFFRDTTIAIEASVEPAQLVDPSLIFSSEAAAGTKPADIAFVLLPTTTSVPLEGNAQLTKIICF